MPVSASTCSSVGRTPTQSSPYRESAKNSSESLPAAGRMYSTASWPSSAGSSTRTASGSWSVPRPVRWAKALWGRKR